MSPNDTNIVTCSQSNTKVDLSTERNLADILQTMKKTHLLQTYLCNYI